MWRTGTKVHELQMPIIQIILTITQTGQSIPKRKDYLMQRR